MKFDQFEARLNDLLDARQTWDADPEVSRLIQESPDHRALALAYGLAVDRQTLDRVAPVPRTIASDQLAQRVLAVVHDPDRTVAPLPAGSHSSQAHSSEWSLGGFTTLTLALAATLLIALGMTSLLSEPTRSGKMLAGKMLAGKMRGDSQPSLPAPNLPVPEAIVEQAPPVADAADPSIGVLMVEARDSYADLARNTQQAMSEVALLLPGFSARSTDRRSEAASVDGEADGAWAGQVSEGLEPLTRSAVGALDFILQTLPVENAAPKS